MIVVVTPMESSFSAGTYVDGLRMQIDMGQAVVTGPLHGALLPDRLTLAVNQARSLGASHLGVLEHDHRFPPNAFLGLAQRGKAIIGANYWERQQNVQVAKKDGAMVDSRGKSGIERVTSIGMGVMLIDLAVFDTLPKPWFTFPYLTDEDRHGGHDVYFCRHAGTHGHEVWCDHDLSHYIAHIAGDVEFWLDRMKFTQTGVEIARR